jgi:tRNA G18 (ribose-2'-O)-methylase SpoU
MEVIRDPGDPRLDDIRDLRRGPGRRRESTLDWFVIEGILALERAVEAGHAIRGVVVTEARRAAVAALGLAEDVRCHVVDPNCLDEVTGFHAHRGVLASAQRPAPKSVAQVLSDARRIIFAEGLSDVENLGSLFRVAAAMGFDAVVLDPSCADPLYRRCVRVSLGWSTAVPWARASSTHQALGSFESHGLRTVALTPSPQAEAVDAALADGILDDPLALMVGAEGPGLADATMVAAQHRVRIPMAGGVDSLNVATALAVVAAFAASAREWQS